MDEPPDAADAEGEDADMAQPAEMDDADVLPPLQDLYPGDAAADMDDADAPPPLQELYLGDAAAADDDWAGEEEPLNECAHAHVYIDGHNSNCRQPGMLLLLPMHLLLHLSPTIFSAADGTT